MILLLAFIVFMFFIHFHFIFVRRYLGQRVIIVIMCNSIVLVPQQKCLGVLPDGQLQIIHIGQSFFLLPPHFPDPGFLSPKF